MVTKSYGISVDCFNVVLYTYLTSFKVYNNMLNVIEQLEFFFINPQNQEKKTEKTKGFEQKNRKSNIKILAEWKSTENVRGKL